MRTGRTSIRAESGGAVIILLAFTLPVLVGFSIFAIDIGNWWVHKRHLQTQADAAALAGAMKFQFPGCSDTLIEQTAIEYSGGRDPDRPGVEPVHNTQLGQTPVDEVHTEINEPSPYERSTPSESELAGSPGPCASMMIDVKMTETDLPWFLDNTGIVEFIDAQARVELKTISSFAGILPVGVEDVSPRRVEATVYDEEAGVELARVKLWQRYTTNDEGEKVPVSEDGLLVFDNKVDNVDNDGDAAIPLTLDMREEVIDGKMVRKERLGLRIALSGSASTTCGDPLVVCYGSSTDGLTRIRGHEDQKSTVHLAEVALLKPTTAGVCADNSFGKHDNGYFSTTCTQQDIQVDLPYVSTAGATCDAVSDPDAAVKAVVDHRNGTRDVSLCWDGNLARWVGRLPINPFGGGTRKIAIDWSQKRGSVAGKGACATGSSNPCKDNYPNAHKLFSGARPVSGPIKELRVDVGGLTNVNNVPRCAASESCPQTFTFRVLTAGRLELAEKGDDPIALRMFGENASDPSQSQGLDCDPKVPGWEDEVAYGCRPEYTRNTGTSCPSNAPTLWGSPQPWDCVATQTGNYTNKSAKALNERILCQPPNSVGNCSSFGKAESCTNPNNWPTWPADDPRWETWAGVPEGDPRIVPLFLVPFGSFNTSGTTTLPVVDFSFFYVTGWTSNGQGFNNPCKNYAPQPDVFVPGTENDNGSISGYFLKYISPNIGGSGDEKCDLQSISGCVAVMTK